MYTNIDTERALSVIANFLQKHPLCRDVANREVIMSALELIMRNNVFRFGDTYWRQLCGTSMSTPRGCSYATLYYAIHELEFYNRFTNGTLMMELLSGIPTLTLLSMPNFGMPNFGMISRTCFRTANWSGVSTNALLWSTSLISLSRLRMDKSPFECTKNQRTWICISRRTRRTRRSTSLSQATLEITLKTTTRINESSSISTIIQLTRHATPSKEFSEKLFYIRKTNHRCTKFATSTTSPSRSVAARSRTTDRAIFEDSCSNDDFERLQINQCRVS